MKRVGGNAQVAAARTDATYLESTGNFVVMGSTFGTRKCLCLTHTPPVGEVRTNYQVIC